MAAFVSLTPLTDRGVVILDELERRTERRRFEVDEDSGTRDYYLAGEQAGPDALDAILDQIASDWPAHLSR